MTRHDTALGGPAPAPATLADTGETGALPVNGRRPVRFTFDGETVFSGTTDGTYWNGFVNVVAVTPAVMADIRASFAAYAAAGLEDETTWPDPEPDGTTDLSWGFATSEWTPEYAETDPTECCGVRFADPCRPWCVNATESAIR